MHETLFSVPIRDLERSDQRRTWEIPPSWLDWALSGSEARSDGSPGALELYLKKTGRQILVKGRARAAVTMPCARTLEPVAVALDAEILLLLSPRPTSVGNPARAGAGAASKPGAGKRQRGAGGAIRGIEAGPGSRAGAPSGAHSQGPSPRSGSVTSDSAVRDDDSDDGSSEILSAEEAARDEYSGDSVELDAFVREHLLLELPLFPVRSDLPFEPNAATNTPPDDSGGAPDPRLAPLAALASQLKMTGKLPK